MSRINVIFKKSSLTSEGVMNLETPAKKKIVLQKLFSFEEKFTAFSQASEGKIKLEQMRQEFYNGLSKEEQLLDRSYNLVLAKDDDLAVMLKYLRSLPTVEDAREDALNVLTYVPNDPKYGDGSLWGMKKISAAGAWDFARGADAVQVVVAVCDTGIDPAHPDIAGNLWNDGNGHFGYDFSDNDNDPRDYHGHGTHVAGTIAALGDNSIGVVGVAFKAKVMSVKVFPNASNSICAQAIMYAANNGAHLINCSWGPSTTTPVPTDPILKAAIDYAYNQRCYCIFAAGNNNIDTSIQFPANYNKVITVGATTPSDTKSSYSNWGSVVDIAAPGDGILSLQMGTSGYVGSSGTSMAAPHVTGAAALILSLAPRLSFDNLRYFLRQSGDAISTSQYIGNVRLNCHRLVAPAIQTYKRQTNVDTANGRYALQANGQIAHIVWNSSGSSWVQSSIAVWGSPVLPGSMVNMGGGRVAGVNQVGNVVNTYGNNYAPLHETFGIVAGTLRYSEARSAFFAVNVFNDFVYIKWGGNGWIMDIIPCWGGALIASSVELTDQSTQISAITINGIMAHTWANPSGTVLSDGSTCSFALIPSTSNLIP